MGVLAPKLLLEWLLVSGRLLVPGFSGQNAKSSRKPIFPLRNVSTLVATRAQSPVLAGDEYVAISDVP